MMNKPVFQRIGDVAYRGLWGGPARPGSVEAMRRSYRYGVPALVDDRDECSMAEILEVVADPRVNAMRRPVYLAVTDLPSRPVRRGVADAADVYAIVRGPSHLAWEVWRWRTSTWQRAGAYLPATAPIDALSALACDAGVMPLVIYEAPAVVAMPGERSMIAELHEDQIQQAVRSYAGAGASIARVTDMFEPEEQPVAARAA